MKKTIFYSFIAAAALMGFASCQKEDLGKVGDDAKKPFTITAEIEDNSTKVTYDVDNTNNKITPAWTVNDEIFCFDSNGDTITFTVTDVKEGKATLTAVRAEYELENGRTLYAIYYPGKGTADFVGEGTSRTLAVDLSSQTGASLGDASPVLMCATATVEDDNVKFIFSNQTAIVGIKKFKVGANETVTSVKASGLVTSGTFSVEDNVLVLTASDKTSDITVNTSESSLTADDKGIVGDEDKPALMFATLPKSSASISLFASTTTSESSAKEYVTLTNLTGTILAGGYYFGTKKLDDIGSNVAMVTINNSSTLYSTLSAAFDAAASTATIKVLCNCEVTETITVGDSKALTLDLNGKTVTTSGDKTATTPYYNRFEVVSGGTLTVTDNSSSDVASQGSIIAKDGTKGTSNILVEGGTLNVQGGSIISNPASSDDIDAAIYGKAGATINISGGYIQGEGSEGALTVDNSDKIAASKCSLCISGGKIERTTSGYHALYIKGSDATISGGDIELTETSRDGKAAIYATNDGITSDLGVINITGGTINSEAQYGVYSNGVAVNVSGGKIMARKPYFMVGTSESNVTGGEIISNKYGYYTFYAGSDAKINVSGGKAYAFSTSTLTSGSGKITFSENVIANKAFISDRVAEGYVNDAYNDESEEDYGTYLFKLAKEDVSINAAIDGYTYNCTVAGATQYVNNYQTAVTLKPQKDLTIDKMISFNSERTGLITLDLNGKTLKYDEESSEHPNYMIKSASSLTVTDSSDPSTGKITAKNCAVCSSGGTLTINGGDISGSAPSTYGGVIYATSDVDNLIIGGGKITCTECTEGRAVNIGCNGSMTGGTIVSSGSGLRMYTAGTTFNVNGTDVQVSNTDNADATLLIANTGTKLNIENGYFYAGNSDESILSKATCISITGGYFNRDVESSVSAGYKVTTLTTPAELDGKYYNYKVEVDSGATKLVEVNGTQYSIVSDAYDAAMKLTGAVTIKLLGDITISSRWDIDKADTETTTLDLNGHNISTAIDSVFTPKNQFTITDSNTGDTKGTITSSKPVVIALNKDCSATVNVNNCTITTTSENITLGNSVIRTSGTSTTATTRIVNIGENAKIIGYSLTLYAYYGTFNISSNAEITATRDTSVAACIYLSTGGKFNISDNASLKGYNAMRSASGNDASSVIISGGYFYASGSDGKILKYTSTYDKRFTFNGGYYNKEVNATLYPNATIKAATTEVTGVTHTHGDETLSYGYQIK